MICPNCGADIENNLTFCTECGAHLQRSNSQNQTVSMINSVATKISPAKASNSSNLKWIGLIGALIIIPAALLGSYFLLKQTRSRNDLNVNSLSNSNGSGSATNKTNEANQNRNNGAPESTEIMNERIEVAPGSNYARPFEVKTETAKITGKVDQPEGDSINGFVFLQEVYDEHSTDPTYKVFSFDTTRNEEINQTLVKGKYVLVFVNNTQKSAFIQGKFALKK